MTSPIIPFKVTPYNQDSTRPHLNFLRQKWLQKELKNLKLQLLRTKSTQGGNALHQSRISARKLRELLRAWRSECHPVKYAELSFELRNLGKALQLGREADVRLQQVTSILRQSPSVAIQEGHQLLAFLDQNRSAIRDQLRMTLDSPRFQRSLAIITEDINSEELMALPHTTEEWGAEQATFSKAAWKLLKNFAKNKTAIHDCHHLRIRIKRIRYYGDALFDLQHLKPTSELKKLHRLQSLLGDIHDNQLLLEWCEQVIPNQTISKLLNETISKSIDKLRNDLDKLGRQKSDCA